MTIKELLARSVENRGTAVALRHKQDGVWREITYAELLTRVRQGAEVLAGAGVQPGDRVALFHENDNLLLVLPLHHAFAFTANLLLAVAAGAETSFVESLRSVGENVREVSPTALIGVPLLIEKMYAKIMRGLQENKKASALLAVGIRGPIKMEIRARLGGRLRIIATGGAPCDPEVLHGFTKLGMPILEGYGLTETSPVLTLNPPEAPRPGTVGIALDNVDVAIDSPDADGVGEIKARGPSIMSGYFNNPEATAAAFQDGWFMTGDLGFIDRDGYITITGRKKSLIVNREGKNIYPEEVEAQVNKSEYVLESMVLGYQEQGDKVGERVGIIVVPDQDAVDAEGARFGNPLSDEQASELLTDQVRTLSRELAEYKRPRKVHVRMGEFEKTSTGKVKRYLYQLESKEIEG